VYYIRRGDSLVACSSFGFKVPVPVLTSKVAHEALESGSLTLPAGSASFIQLIEGHFLATPATQPLPSSDIDEWCRIINLSPLSKEKFRLYPPEYYNETSAHELVRLGLSRNFLFVSFFTLDAGALIAKSVLKCPHADKTFLEDEIRGYAIMVLGSSGHALSLKDGTCFCVFYSHAPGDSELIAIQVARTLSRALSLSPDEGIKIGPFSVAKLSDNDAEPILRSFIDGR